MNLTEPEKKRRCGRSGKHSVGVDQSSTGLHGLFGLELSALRKSFNGQTKYNFDEYLNRSIPEQYAIEVIDDEKKLEGLLGEKDGDKKGQLRPYQNDDQRSCTWEQLKSSLRGKFDVNLVTHSVGRGLPKTAYPVGGDPLNDDVYSKAHDKLAKKEKKFISADRDRMANEVDDCMELLSLLGVDIKRNVLRDALQKYVVENMELTEEQIFRLSHLLGTITTIADPTNTTEMVLKYRLTIRELCMFLLNYMKMKTLEGMLKKQVLKSHLGSEDPFMEPDTESDIEKLKAERLRQRERRMGKIVCVKFKEGVKLVIDPRSGPRVVGSKKRALQ